MLSFNSVMIKAEQFIRGRKIRNRKLWINRKRSQLRYFREVTMPTFQAEMDKWKIEPKDSQ